MAEVIERSLGVKRERGMSERQQQNPHPCPRQPRHDGFQYEPRVSKKMRP
jgi:hypothetical protein